jgi:integrase
LCWQLPNDLERVEVAAKPSLYDPRHTAATLALATGGPAKVVSEWLGHASVAFTLDSNYVFTFQPTLIAQGPDAGWLLS